MRCLYGNYRVDQGSVLVKHKSTCFDLPKLAPHEILEVRKTTISYVSQCKHSAVSYQLSAMSD